MKIKNIILSLLALNLVSCVKQGEFTESFYQHLVEEKHESAQNFEGNRISYADLRAKATQEIQLYQTDDAFEGYVISSDEGGNFYKKIYIQSADKSGTIAVALEKKGLFGDFPVGRKVQVRLKGLSFWYNRYSTLEVGYGEGRTAGGNQKIANIPPAMHWKVILTKDSLPLEELATEITDLSQINQNHLNQLVILKNVQFEVSAHGKPFHQKQNKYGTTYKLQDENRNSLNFNTSGFASHKDELVPSEKINVVGIIIQAGRNNFQISINTTKDIQIVN